MLKLETKLFAKEDAKKNVADLLLQCHRFALHDAT